MPVMNTENQYTKRIKDFSHGDWIELQSLYRRVASHDGSFYAFEDCDSSTECVMQLPYILEADIVRDVRQYLYSRNLVVLFDWSHWEAGREFFRSDAVDKFDSISAIAVLKLLTAVIRNDRFNDGAFAHLFETGDAARLLARLLDFMPAATD